MARIIPFRAYRYNPSVVHDLSDVVSPPYDRVSDAVQDECYRRSPYNIVRITKGRAEPGDGESANVYTRAAQSLNDWISEGVLIRDEQASIYAYHQTYTFNGVRLTRRGIIALGVLEPEKVHAHEKTLRGPKEDRLRLMRTTQANFGHIFMLYNDPTRAIERTLTPVVEGLSPQLEAYDADGNKHEAWRVIDADTIRAVQTAVAEKDLYIADGHHRYETAVNNMNECRAATWSPAAPESFDVRMMTLFNVAEPGMSIRPIHRLVHGIEAFDEEAFLSTVSEHFHVTPHDSVESMIAATREGLHEHTLGCVSAGRTVTLTLKEEGIMDRLGLADRSVDYRRLDVTVLQEAILHRILGIDDAALEEQRNITYTVDVNRGLADVRQGKEQLFLYLNPTRPEEVLRVADHGEKMPQKSTDFYPKLLTGLVLMKMEIAKP